MQIGHEIRRHFLKKVLAEFLITSVDDGLMSVEECLMSRVKTVHCCVGVTKPKLLKRRTVIKNS